MSPRIPVTITCLSVACLLWAAPALADPAPTTQPDGLAATAAAPTTQPELSVSVAGLPPRLQAQNRLVFIQMSTEQRKVMRDNVASILKRTNEEVVTFFRHKNQFDLLAPEVQERYRQKASLIEQVLDRLSPTEQARLLNLPAEERAKRVLELVAELKIQQSRTPPPAPPQPAP